MAQDTHARAAKLQEGQGPPGATPCLLVAGPDTWWQLSTPRIFLRKHCHALGVRPRGPWTPEWQVMTVKVMTACQQPFG